MDQFRTELIDNLFIVFKLEEIANHLKGVEIDPAITEIRKSIPDNREEYVKEMLRNKDKSKLLEALELSQGVAFGKDNFQPEVIANTPWVGDIPHSVLHGSMGDVLEYLRREEDSGSLCQSLSKIQSMQSSQNILSVLPIVVMPARYQRSDRLRKFHYYDEDTTKREPCICRCCFEGIGYIEDGNHRALAQLHRSGKPSFSALFIKFDE